MRKKSSFRSMKVCMILGFLCLSMLALGTELSKKVEEAKAELQEGVNTWNVEKMKQAKERSTTHFGPLKEERANVLREIKEARQAGLLGGIAPIATALILGRLGVKTVPVVMLCMAGEASIFFQTATRVYDSSQRLKKAERMLNNERTRLRARQTGRAF